MKVRIEVANRDYALKPEMFADVVLRRELGDALFVPESAVLKPGDRQLVFLDRGDGRLEPREIETGAASREATPSSRDSPRATRSSPPPTS